MMSPQDVLQAGQRTIAPRTGLTPRMEGNRSTRDERRRATHNEGLYVCYSKHQHLLSLHVRQSIVHKIASVKISLRHIY